MKETEKATAEFIKTLPTAEEALPNLKTPDEIFEEMQKAKKEVRKS